MNSQGGHARGATYWSLRGRIALLVLGAVAAYFLFAEHRAHVAGALPYLLLLACPLMHVFMHGGHGQGHRGHGAADAPQRHDNNDPSPSSEAPRARDGGWS